MLRPPRPQSAYSFAVPSPELEAPGPAGDEPPPDRPKQAPAAPTSSAVAATDIDIDNVLPADESDADLSKLLVHRRARRDGRRCSGDEIGNSARPGRIERK